MTPEEFVAGEIPKPWAWGEVDCTLFPADWVRAVTGVDPAASFRGKYDSELSAHRMLKSAGGFVAAISAEMALHGFDETDAPVSGDVGIVEVIVDRKGAQERAPVSAILVGRRWVVRAIDGVQAGSFPLLKAWAVRR